jgi:hypothetical protein
MLVHLSGTRQEEALRQEPVPRQLMEVRRLGLTAQN